MNLPTYFIEFDETKFTSGIDEIAITENPAIEIMSMRFNKDEKVFKFSFDEEKRLIVGPALVPNKKIYRRDGDYEYYVVFTEDTIEKMVEKFNSELREIKFNLEHSDTKIKGFIKESWIVEDPKFDKSKLYGFELEKGTWVISAKIEDEEMWEHIKSAENVGFSIEGLMGISEEAFKQINNNLNINKMSKKVKKSKFFATKTVTKRKFNKSIKSFEDVVIDEENEVLIVENLAVGAEVETISDEGEIVEAEDGVYVIEDEGVEIIIADAEIVEINEIEAVTEEEEVFEEESVQVDIDFNEFIQKLAELEMRIESLEKDVADVEDDLEDKEFKIIKPSAIDALIAFNKKNKKK